MPSFHIVIFLNLIRSILVIFDGQQCADFTAHNPYHHKKNNIPDPQIQIAKKQHGSCSKKAAGDRNIKKTSDGRDGFEIDRMMAGFISERITGNGRVEGQDPRHKSDGFENMQERHQKNKNNDIPAESAENSPQNFPPGKSGLFNLYII